MDEFEGAEQRRLAVKEEFDAAVAHVRILIDRTHARQKRARILTDLISAHESAHPKDVRTLLDTAKSLIDLNVKYTATPADLALYTLMLGMATTHGVLFDRDVSCTLVLRDTARKTFASITEPARVQFHEEGSAVYRDGQKVVRNTIAALGIGGEWCISLGKKTKFVFVDESRLGAWLKPRKPLRLAIPLDGLVYSKYFGYGTREELVIIAEGNVEDARRRLTALQKKVMKAQQDLAFEERCLEDLSITIVK